MTISRREVGGDRRCHPATAMGACRAMAVKDRLLHLIGWERHFEFGRSTRWVFGPALRAGLHYRHVVSLGPWSLMFGAKSDEERKAAMGLVMAEAADLATEMRELAEQDPENRATLERIDNIHDRIDARESRAPYS